MKSIYKLLIAGAVIAGSASVATAQQSYSGYFLDNFNYRYQMNPAYGNENNFIAMPALGNLGVGVKGSLNLDQVVYPLDGQTVLFTDPRIGTDEVMKKIKDTNKITFNLKEQILAGGFKAWGGYNTITLSAVANAYVGVPKTFFSLAKEGLSNRTYDISNLRVQANAMAELALGHSRDLGNVVPGLRVGGTLKFYIGGGNLDAYLHQADLNLGKDNWIVTSNADIYASIKGFKYKMDTDDNGREYVNGFEVDGAGIDGFGMGLDLGATYHMGDWNFSFAVLDLGFISYPQTYLATTDGVQTVESDAFTFNPDDSAPNSFENEWDRLKTQAYDLYQLKNKGDIGSRTRGLATTLNFGAEYELPYYRNLHFALLNSTRIYGAFTTTEFRLSANVRPVKCFSADVNLVMGTYGAALGWMANLNLTGFNLFIGMDRTLGKLSKQCIPLKSNASLNLGINFPF